MADARRRLDPLDAVAGLAVVAWLGWVVAAAILTGRPLPLTSPYVVAPLVGVAGVIAGRLAARHAPTWPVGAILLTAGVVFGVAALLTPIPGKFPTRYPNANAAFGVQLMALTGLLGLSLRRRPRPAPTPNLEVGRRTPAPGLLAVAAALSAAAVVAVNASDAATLLAVPVGLTVLVAVLTRWGPWRAFTVAVGLGALGAGAAGLLWLASRDDWPDLAVRGFSRVRQQLWQLALRVWRGEGLIGAGPGRYAEVNPLAADPDTAAAHSSLLQVGADLGHVGVALFGVLLLVGVALAARRGRAEALIAVAAWTALGVHSFVDHLYEFPVVTFAAAAVIGWASTVAQDQPAASIPSLNTGMRASL